MTTTPAMVDSRGAFVIPKKIREQLGIEPNGMVLLDVCERRLVIRPAMAVSVERYSPRRVAEFLLNNAIDTEEYARAVEDVRSMGIDPGSIPHEPPA